MMKQLPQSGDKLHTLPHIRIQFLVNSPFCIYTIEFSAIKGNYAHLFKVFTKRYNLLFLREGKELMQ